MNSRVLLKNLAWMFGKPLASLTFTHALTSSARGPGLAVTASAWIHGFLWKPRPNWLRSFIRRGGSMTRSHILSLKKLGRRLEKLLKPPSPTARTPPGTYYMAKKLPRLGLLINLM